VLALVTGAAGFIGSSITDRLLDDGWRVRGADRFTAYYGEAQKRGNLLLAADHAGFDLVEADLLTCDLDPLVADVDVVFHLAGQPGVRMSWADGFKHYSEINVEVTQRLLEAAHRNDVDRFVYASSSSVYGNAASYPTRESDPVQPYSPYGVTKLAGELLCNAYAANHGLPVASLRYFTVYGPRQRPDMAIHRMIEAALGHGRFQLFGNGDHVRDFTYVDDVVDATVRAGTVAIEPGAVLNVAGGASTSMNELIDLVGRAVGQPIPLESSPVRAGDVNRTGGDISRTAKTLGWTPQIDITSGVERQVAWHRERARG